MNSLKNKRPAQLITVVSSALLVSGLLWSDESFVTVVFTATKAPVRHTEMTITKGLYKVQRRSRSLRDNSRGGIMR